MGWSWNKDNENSNFASGDISDGDRCGARKVVSSKCRTEEVETGKFVRKCEKTEEIFKDCIGRPSEMVQSTKEYTEEDVPDQIVKGSFPSDSSENGAFYFPGLRSDIEAIERSVFGSIHRFFEAAEDMRNEFFDSVGAPGVFSNEEARSSRKNRGIEIEDRPPRDYLPEKKTDGDVDLSGLARDV